MPNLTTIAEWAQKVGISRQSAYEAVKRCEIPVTDGKVDADYATHLYRANTRQRANGSRPDPVASGSLPAGAVGTGGMEPSKVPGYDTSRARREAAEAAKAELQLAELAGRFLLKSDVEAVAFEIARSLRDGLSNSARRIAAEVAALDTTEACEEVIDRELSALLASMTQSLRADLAIDVSGAVE